MKTKAKGELHRFRIGTDWSRRRRSITVVVYDSHKAMIEATVRWHQGTKSEAHYQDTHAIVQTWKCVVVKPDGTDKETADLGFVRLYRGALGVGILAHECTHVASTIFYGDIGKIFPNRETSDAALEREEQLAYIVGDLMNQLVAALYRRGYYRKARGKK